MTRRIRITHFSPWADRLEDVSSFLQRLPQIDLTPKVARPEDPELMQMARLDCDWHAENSRVFGAMTHAQIDFLPARVAGGHGLVELARSTRPNDEEWWLLFDGQTPQTVHFSTAGHGLLEMAS